jgi:hypothetical protein
MCRTCALIVDTLIAGTCRTFGNAQHLACGRRTLCVGSIESWVCMQILCTTHVSHSQPDRQPDIYYPLCDIHTTANNLQLTRYTCNMQHATSLSLRHATPPHVDQYTIYNIPVYPTHSTIAGKRLLLSVPLNCDSRFTPAHRDVYASGYLPNYFLQKVKCRYHW